MKIVILTAKKYVKEVNKKGKTIQFLTLQHDALDEYSLDGFVLKEGRTIKTSTAAVMLDQVEAILNKVSS